MIDHIYGNSKNYKHTPNIHRYIQTHISYQKQAKLQYYLIKKKTKNKIKQNAITPNKLLYGNFSLIYCSAFNSYSCQFYRTKEMEILNQRNDSFQTVATIHQFRNRTSEICFFYFHFFFINFRFNTQMTTFSAHCTIEFVYGKKFELHFVYTISPNKLKVTIGGKNEKMILYLKRKQKMKKTNHRQIIYII